MMVVLAQWELILQLSIKVDCRLLTCVINRNAYQEPYIFYLNNFSSLLFKCG